MAQSVDTSAWSGEGEFTQGLVEYLSTLETIASIKVENAPATRSDADYNFIANEIFVGFTRVEREMPVKRLGIIPGTQKVSENSMTLELLGSMLEHANGIGAADYADEGMLQYLRTERVIPHYQTRGYKLIELVRIYEVGTPSRA